MTTDICKRLGLENDCRLTVQHVQCHGFADLNGDGMEDYVMIGSVETLTAAGTVKTPLLDILYHGYIPSAFKSVEDYLKAMDGIEFHQKKKKGRIRLGDIVSFNGKEYIATEVRMNVGCSEDGRFIFERGDTSILIVPVELAKRHAELAKKIAAVMAEMGAVNKKAQTAAGDEKKKLAEEFKKKEAELAPLMAAVQELEKKIGEEHADVPIDELILVESK